MPTHPPNSAVGRRIVTRPSAWTSQSRLRAMHRRTLALERWPSNDGTGGGMVVQAGVGARPPPVFTDRGVTAVHRCGAAGEGLRAPGTAREIAHTASPTPALSPAARALLPERLPALGRPRGLWRLRRPPRDTQAREFASFVACDATSPLTKSAVRLFNARRGGSCAPCRPSNRWPLRGTTSRPNVGLSLILDLKLENPGWPSENDSRLKPRAAQ